MKPSQLLSVLPEIFKTNRSPMIWGDPGIGKTAINGQVSVNMKVQFMSIILSLYDPADVRGFPVLVGTGKNARMQFIQLGMFPRDGKGILLVDELPSAPMAVQTVMYQLFHERRIGEYILPAGWKLAGAGNYAHNGGVHYAMPPALENRLIHLEIEPYHPDWDVWAAQNGISDTTRAFLRFRPDLFHDMSVRKQGQHGWPSARSWHTFDDVMKNRFTAAEQLEIGKGIVGAGPAIEYAAFIDTVAELPSEREIVATPDTARVPTSPGAKHAVSLLAERIAEKTTFKSCCTYMQRLGSEFQTKFMTSIASHKLELTETREFVDWAMSNKAVLSFN